MPTMTYVVTEDDGITPIPGIDVKVEMPNQAVVIATGAVLSGSVWGKTDDVGSVSFDLVATALLNPSGTHYELSTPYLGDNPPLPFTAPNLSGTRKVTDYLAEELPLPGPIVVGVSQDVLDAALAGITGGFTGPAGQPRYAGIGPPPVTIIGSAPGDIYLDASNGDLYQLT